MDCDRAIEAVLEAQDMGRSEVPDIAEALAHCETCAACRATARSLAALRDAPPPKAPDALTAQVLTAVAAERAAGVANAAIDAAERREAGDGADAAFAAPPVPLRRQPAWLPWATVGVSAAAVLLLAVGVARYGLTSLGVRTEEDTEIVAGSAAPEAGQPYVLPTPGASDKSASTPQDSENAGASATPGFILYEDRVWRFAEGMTADPSALAAAGDVRTDLGTGDTDLRPAYERPGEDTVVYVEGDDDVAHGFTLVTRVYRGRRFALAAARGLAEFGEWPQLPPSVPMPGSADGSPAFEAAGTDDLGVTVYPLAGTAPEAGFAVAPGTQPSDPAAGNPNWTWWAPISE